jgi:hypothetical protein
MLSASTAVYTGVVVTNADHPRTGQAGSYLGHNADAPDTRADVRFDKDGATEAVAFADLRAL